MMKLNESLISNPIMSQGKVSPSPTSLSSNDVMLSTDHDEDGFEKTRPTSDCHSIVNNISQKSIAEAKNLDCITRMFAIGFTDKSIETVHYVLFDWASKVTNIAFSICFPLLISTLGDQALGKNKGRILWSYLTVTISILTALSFMTFTSVLEYGLMKRKALFRFAFIACIFLILFFVCFTPGSVYIASIFAIIAKVCHSIANVAYDSLLDAISYNKDPHAISSRSSILGYSGMVTFIFTAAPILAVFYFAIPHLSTLWLQGIIPIVLVGIWYLIFLLRVNRYLPKNLGRGIPFGTHTVVAPPQPLLNEEEVDERVENIIIGGENSNNNSSSSSSSSSGSNNSSNNGNSNNAKNSNNNNNGGSSNNNNNNSNRIINQQRHNSSISTSSSSPRTITTRLLNFWILIKFGFIQGSALQYENIQELNKYPDLSKFILAFIFLSGATSVAQSVAVIVATQILKVGIGIIIAATLIGLFSAVVGILFFKYLIQNQYIRPKWVIVINMIIIILLMAFVLYIQNSIQLLIAAGIVGSQVGPIGALSKSILSSLIPAQKQSRLFSLYQFSQDATSWIGSLIIASIVSAYGGGNTVYLHTVIYTCMVQIGIGIPFFLLMDYNRGVQQRHDQEILLAAELAAAAAVVATTTEATTMPGSSSSSSIITYQQSA